MSLPADIERYVARAFAAPDQAPALELVRNAVTHDGQPAAPRLLRCALVSSRGNLDTLRAQIAHLKVDFRDVIVEGEYMPQGGTLVHVRDLNEPIQDDV